MKHISLYRKWRPQTFNKVIGQEHITKTLANAIQGDRLVHAYLFCGPRGTGKTSTARILAKAVNCAEGPTPEPCNQCNACKEISAGTSLDVIEIDAASNRGIDEIRDLRDKIIYAPTSFRKKMYVIDEVHMLTTEASNALLKMLEEPPGHVIFVLATTEPRRVLPTIVSRCQRFDFWPVPASAMAAHLKYIAGEESISIEEEALDLIAEHARGSVRDAIGVLDQISSVGGEGITAEDVAVLLGTVESALVFEALKLIEGKDTAGNLALVQRLEGEGKDNRRFVAELVDHLHGVFLIQNSKNPREVVNAIQEHYLKMEEIARGMPRHEVIRLMELFGETYREMRWTDNPRLLLEVALVKATRPSTDISLEGLGYRLAELERLMAGESGARQDSEGSAGRSKKTRQSSTGKGSEGGSGGSQGDEEKIEAGGSNKQVAPVSNGTSAKKVEAEPQLNLERVRNAWPAVLSSIKQEEMPVYALLMSARLVSLEGRTLELGFPPGAFFQRAKLEDAKEQATLRSALRDALGVELDIVVTGPDDYGARAQAESGGSRKRREELPDSENRVGVPLEGTGGKGGSDPKAEAKASPTEEEIIEMVKEGLDGEVFE